MSTVTLRNSYQMFGTEVPEGMSTIDALEMAGMAGWNQRLAEPIVVDGVTEYNVGKHRYVIADLPIGPRVLGAVTESYRVVSNEECYIGTMDGFKDRGLQPIVLGAYDNGASSFCQFSLPDGGEHLWVGDDIATTIVITKKNDGTGAIKGFPTTSRLRCANEIGAISKSRSPILNVRHTRSAEVHAVQTVEELLGITHDWDDILRQEVERLAASPMTYADFTDSFVPALLGDRPEDAGRSQSIHDKKFEEIVAAWSSPTAPEGLSAWRAWNSVSLWEQHERGSSEERRALAVLHNRQPYSNQALALLS